VMTLMRSEGAPHGPAMAFRGFGAAPGYPSRGGWASTLHVFTSQPVAEASLGMWTPCVCASGASASIGLGVPEGAVIAQVRAVQALTVSRGGLMDDIACRIPRWIKLLVTAWTAMLVLEHCCAVPLSLLWFCNVALLLTCVGLWLESSFLLSMQAVGSVLWMSLWFLDFWIHILTGVKSMEPPLGISNYMFDPQLSLLSRGLSLYHVWIPFVLLFSIKRLGYDRRAAAAQTLLAWFLLLLSYGLTTNMHGPAGNLNRAYGLSASEPQQWVSPSLWLVIVMLVCPICCYYPTHLVLRRLFQPPHPRSPGLY
jgi:hypothetical protein